MTAAPLSEWDGEPVAALRARWGAPLLEAYELCTSTNDRAAALAAAGAPPYAAVVADAQSEGRGRRGARWECGPGDGLLMSLVLPDGVDAAPHLPLVIGLAVAEAVEEVTGVDGLAIEWPNDVLARERKLAGVLCEASGGRVVAGVGVNVRTPSGGFRGGLAERAVALDVISDKSFCRSDMGIAISSGIEARVTRAGSALDDETREALRARDALLGRSIACEAGGEGRGAGLAEDGALLLRRPDGSTTRVVAGRVRLR